MPRLPSGKYKVTRGPLAGRTYKSERTYRSALGKFRERVSEFNFNVAYPKEARLESLFKSEGKWDWMWHEYIANKGLPTVADRVKFVRLYAEARKSKFDVNRKGAYARLLDLSGIRSLDDYGKWNVGDTPDA